MSDNIWLEVVARISAVEPVDLDISVFASAEQKKAAPGRQQFEANASVTTSTRLWDTKEPGQSYIGIRVNEQPADCARAALRLAAAALERGVVPIIITTLPNSGFERFGFRVERIIGSTEQDTRLLEDEIRQFWDIALEIDISEVVSIG